MRKSLQPILILLVVFNVCAFKTTHASPKLPVKTTVTAEEKELLFSQNFADFVYEFGKNSLDFSSELKQHNSWNADFANKLMACTTREEAAKICESAGVSFETVLHTNVTPNAQYVNFLYNHPNYRDMDEKLQTNEYGSLVSKICTDNAFRENNANAPLVTALANLYNYASTRRGSNTGTANLFNLTWDELGGCLVAGLGSYVASNYKAIKTAWNLLTGDFSLGNIVRVLELAFPEFKAVGALITTAACIIKEWIW